MAPTPDINKGWLQAAQLQTTGIFSGRVDQWVALLPLPIQAQYLKNMDPEKAKVKVATLSLALKTAFQWYHTPEGYRFWLKYFDIAANCEQHNYTYPWRDASDSIVNVQTVVNSPKASTTLRTSRR